jgi:phosphoribosylanthranilate isomerase
VAPAVKICGLTRLEDGVAAAEAGADFLGLIASSGYGRSAPEGLGHELAHACTLPVVAVLVDEPLDRAALLAEQAGASVLQLHGSESPEALASLRERGPWKLWKALRVRTEEDVRQALNDYGAVADGLLLDGWHPSLAGGSGTRFPWEVVESVREEFPPGLVFVAAGGLTPDNVAEAAARLRPDVVDVSSGVEKGTGIKDSHRIRSFIQNAKRVRR